MTLDFNQVLDKGFLLFFGVCVIGSVAWLGRRLFGKGGVLTDIAAKHIEYLHQTEKMISTIADSTERLSQTNAVICENSQKSHDSLEKLKRATHHTVKILKHFSIKLEIYEDVRGSLEEIDTIVNTLPRKKD